MSAPELTDAHLLELGRQTAQAKRYTGRVRLTFTDGAVKTVKAGGYAQIAAKRQFGREALAEGDPEAILWACWVELHGPPERGSDVVDRFDAWLMTVADTDMETVEERAALDRDEDPTTAESSGSLLASPPTSASTPTE